MKRVHKIVGLALAVATVAAIIGTTAVLAQSPTPDATKTGQRPAIGERIGRPGMGGPRQGGNTAVNEAIAGALGMTVDELQTARQAGKNVADLAEEKGVALQSVKDAADAAQVAQVKAQIEAQVTAGDLTREKADWMLKGIAAGWDRLGGKGIGAEAKGVNVGLEAAAKALGLTTDEMQLQMWGGRTLATMAEKAGVELSTVTDAVKAAEQAALRERIAAAVTAGTITQEQADWILQGMEKGYMPGGHGFGGGMRGGFGCGPRGGGSEGAPEGAPSTLPQSAPRSTSSTNA